MPHTVILLETARKLADQHDFDGPSLREAIPYLEAFQGKKMVLKIGGSILYDTSLMPALVSDIAFLKRLDINLILVHGGARHVDRAMQERGLKPEKIHGLRVTTRAVLEIAQEVFLGISQQIKTGVEERGYRGVILDRSSGLIKSRQKDPQLQYVGEPVNVNTEILDGLAADTIAIIPSITAGMETGDPGFNVNADEVASSVARTIRAEKLILMTDVDGVLDEHGNIISTLTAEEVTDLVGRGVITAGMLPKVRACLEPLQFGVHKSHIIRGDADSFINEILTDAGAGTQFIASDKVAELGKDRG